MAEKEATVYVVDVGASMGEKNHGRDETDLEWGMKYIWDKIATTVSTGRKTACAGVVAFRTDGTENELGDDESYANISVLQPIGQVLMPDLRKLSESINPSHTNDGDAISALVVAIQMIAAFCKKLKYYRKIILVTNGKGPMDADLLSEIARKINEDSIELVVLGADFDDPDFGYKEEDKDEIKTQNEETFRQLVDDCNGVFGTLRQAVSELGIPRVKAVRPVHSYRGLLTLGSPEQYQDAMSIDVERYPRTMIAKAPTASSYVIKSDMAPEELQPGMANGDTNNEAGANDLTSVYNARTYQVKDEAAPGGKRDVDREDLAKGYEYGRTAVHISESDETVTKLETKAGLEIVGFVPKDNYKQYMSMSRSNIIIAQRTNEKAILALSSFIHALYELDSYAVARLVTKDDKEPVLVLLAYFISKDYECLHEVELPFAEDVRTYKFPPLDRIVTISGKVLKEHRNLPTDELQDAMGEFVDQMDISAYDRDDEGNPTEYLAMDDTYSPLLHRINQAIRHRAVHPTGDIPPPHDAILKPIHPPTDLLQKAAPSLEKVKEAANVKKVPPRALSRKRFRSDRNREQPRSGLDVAALLSSRTAPSHKISADNAIPEFKQLLAAASSVDTIKSGVEQLSAIIEDWIAHSLGDSNYDRAVEAMGVMREECVELEEPSLYNDFVRALKKKLLDDEALGGDRREMWWKVRGMKLGLIDKKVNPVSDVDEEEAAKFYSMK